MYKQKPLKRVLFRSTLGRTLIGVLLCVFVLVILPLFSYTRARVHAAAALNLNFQARLLNAAGGIVPDGTYNIEFKLYNVSSGGATQWTETLTGANKVTLKNGYFSVNLGAITAFPGGIDWSQEEWLTMNIGGTGAPSWDGEMSPRIKLTAVPRAFSSDTLDGLDSADFAQLAPGSLQGVNSANTAIRLNQTGAGDLLQLQGNGSDVLTLTKTGNLAVAGTGTFSGASVTVGTSSVAGSLVLYDGSSNTATLQAAALGQNTVYTLPDPGGATDTVCLQTLANCGSSSTSILQGGNSFTADVTIGSNDNYSLNFETNGTTKFTITTGGNLQLAQGANRTFNVAANSTANGAGYNFTIAAGAADGTAAGNTGGALALQGGAAAGSGNNSGGNVTLDGGAATGSGAKGHVILQGAAGNVGIGDTTPSYLLTVGSGDLFGVDSSGYVYAPRFGGTASTMLWKGSGSGLILSWQSGDGNWPILTPGNTNADFNLNSGAGSLVLGGTSRASSLSSASAITVSTTGAGNDIIFDSADIIDVRDQVVFTGISNDITTATNEDFTVQANGSGSIILNNNVGVGEATPAYQFTVGSGDLSGIDSFGNFVIKTGGAAATGDLSFGQGANRSVNVLGATTANAAGFNLSLTAGAANGSTTGNTGGALALQGGAAAGSGNNSGGNVTLDGGAATGSGAKGHVILQGAAGNVGIGDTTPSYLLTVGSGDLFGVNSSGNVIVTTLGTANNNTLVCRNNSNQLATCSGTGSGAFFAQGGNSFSAAGDLGTNDNNVLNLRTNNTTKLTISTGGDLQFAQGANRTLSVADNTTANGAGYNFTLAAGAANGSTTGAAGGSLILQGGAAAGSGNNNGGAVTINGGAGTGTGTQGLVNLSTTAFTSAAVQTFASSGTFALTAGNVDLYSSLPITATTTNVIVTVPDPAQSITGRLIYIAARSGSNDFTLRLNSARTPIDIAMKATSTATLVWNGTDWTAAGASSSTDLQSAYNNTLTSAGGAELVLAAIGGNADGLTVRNNATTPIIGAIFEAQTSIGSNLLSVNNNAAEYASNGGAETAGGSSTTFPSSTWSASATGGSQATVSRDITAGEYVTGVASVKVVTTGATTAGQGAADQLTTSLTANLTYTVSFTVKGTSNFSTLDVVYSKDGTNTSTTSCITGETVTQSIWSRITCSFTAPSSGITSSNAIFIRQSNSNSAAKTFYIDNLSVSVSASISYAVDGSVDSALGTNWTAFGAGTTVTRITTNVYDTSGSVQVDTTNNTDRGLTNNLSVAPAASTQYLVTFYAKLLSGTFTDIRVRYSRDGGTNFVTCTDYNIQTLITTTWTKITCLFTTDGTASSDPDLIIDQPTAPGSTRTFYVDALTVTLNTNNASNVQIGGANKGGPSTLLTLDRASSAPIAANNDAYLGSMYYDTTTGRIQCYEADGWGACGSAPDNIVNLSPEYAGSVLNGTGVGTMTADFCANQTSVLTVNTSFCSSGESRNFYKWTSPQASQQTYSIYITYQLPTTFKAFASDDTVQLTGRVDSTSNAAVTYQMFRNEGGSIAACGTETTITSSTNTWQTVGINGNEATGCGFTSSSGGAFVIFKINLKTNSNANAYVSTLSFTTTGK
jgi:hypothetical protein